MCVINMYRAICVLTLIILTNALPNPETKDVVTEPTRILTKDCSNGIFNPACLKIEALSLIEKLNSKEELRLLPGVSIVKEKNKQKDEDITAELAKSGIGKDEKVDKYLLYKIGSYLDSHSVKLRLLDEGSSEEARGLIGEGRGKGGGGLGGGKKGGMGGLLAVAALFKGTLFSVALGALALLAGKALVTAMMSLLLSAIIGIKSLSSGQKSTTYEIVSKPVYSHSHSSGHEDVGAYSHGGYGRSINQRRKRSVY